MVASERTILYEFNLTCGHVASVHVDDSFEPLNPETGEPDVHTSAVTREVSRTYTCPICGAQETP